PELVRAPSWSGREPHLLWRRRRLDRVATLALVAHRAGRLAHRVLDAGPPGARGARAAESFAEAKPGGPRARARRRRDVTPRGDLRAAESSRPGVGGRRLDARPGAPEGPLLVDRRRVLLRALRLVCRAGPSDEISRRDRIQPDPRGVGAWIREPGRRARANRARSPLGPDRSRMGMDHWQLGLRALSRRAARPSPRADGAAALVHGRRTGHARPQPHVPESP